MRQSALVADLLRSENYDLKQEVDRQRNVIRELEARLAELSSDASKVMLEHGEAPCEGCRQTVAVAQAYRCFRCGLWFCRECGQEHFG